MSIRVSSCSLILLLVAFVICVVVAEVITLRSPGNKLHKLSLCENQKPEDAVADFLLRHGVHDEHFQPIQDEYDYLMHQLCETLRTTTVDVVGNDFAGENSESNGSASPFISDQNRFLTLYMNDKPDDTIHSEDAALKYPVYLRVGYSGKDHTTCVCSKIGCSDLEFIAIEDYISGSLRAMNA